MTSKPLVSVLMPVFNGEKYLKDAVESILNQSFTDFEFLIIDDGSTDSSFEIISSYKDSRIRVIRHESNLGLIKSLNKGIELSNGEFIARMDCDDVSYINRLEEQLAFMTRHLDIGISGTWMHASDTGKIVSYPETHEECIVYKFFNSPLAHPTIIFRRDFFLINNLKYSIDYPVCEDIELWRRCMQYTRLGNLCEPLLYYRIHAANISTKNKSIQKESLLKYYHEELETLGIEAVLIDIDLHFAFIRPEITDATKVKYDFKDFCLWANLLLDTNNKNEVYSKEYFEKLLSRNLTIIALHYIKRSSTWYYYHKSVLTKKDYFYFEFIQFSVKVIINKLKKLASFN